MATILSLIRRPRTRQMWPVIKQELQEAYCDILLPAVVAKYAEIAQFNKWAGKPEIKMRTRISGQRYLVQFHVDIRTRLGKIFMWVDKGTGLEGPKHSEYLIVPKNAEYLAFDVPYHPYTYPPEALRYDPNAPSAFIKTQEVHHPGIQARRFSEQVLKWAKDRYNTKGFYRVTENAYRRGFRKVQRAR